MTEQTPIERLQPCLLDRLTDDEPEQKVESRMQRTISRQRYIRGVLRDLQWMFNTQAYLDSVVPEKLKLSDFPEASKSVLNFGTRQMAGANAPDMELLCRDLKAALLIFEPRIDADTLSVEAENERNTVTLRVRGALWTNQQPAELDLKSTVDLENERFLLGDSSTHG